MPDAATHAGPVLPPRERRFVHLHLHTEFSLLDGGNRVDRLAKRVAELGMDAVACTDHGNLFGAVAFYHACKEHGVKPILGVEAYVTPPDKPRTDRTYTGGGEGGFHLVLLCENNAGWQNLLRLASEAYLTGFYYRPRIDRALLEAHSEGLIAINGHLGSEIGDHLLSYDRTGDEKYWALAVESARWHDRVFNAAWREARARGQTGPRAGGGPRFYLEIQHHVKEQNALNPHVIRMARELDLPVVCDNDSHFLRREDHDAHDTLICISTGKAKSEDERLHYPPDIYVKSPEEMRSLFEREYGDVGRAACDATVEIAERCHVELPLGANNAPMVRVRVPEASALPRHDDPSFAGDLTAWYTAYCRAFEVLPFDRAPTAEEMAESKAQCDRALRLLAEGGFVWRYGPTHPSDARAGADHAERRARLERELKILADKNISAYFLIVWDFVNWGRQRGIPANARGSGVGTMVGYVMGLSNACPVRYGLLFERFTDPDRSEYPDIDIDLCQDGRAEVIEYVRAKYGHVAQIITFGTMKARAAIRDVGRVLALELPYVDRIAKLVPETLNITLDDALTESPDLRKIYNEEADARRLIDTARMLEGQVRHAGVHAAGVIVATRPLHEIVPLYRQPGSPETDVVTQWDGPTCERMGLLKMDFLGLRTLSVIERAKKLIRESLSEEEIWKAVGGQAQRVKSPSGPIAKAEPSGVGGRADPSGHWESERLANPHPLDLDRLNYDDQNVLALFRRGDTTGVFQFESPGMRRLLVEMKPDRLEDLIAANALYRPGPMDLIPDYNARKHKKAAIPSLHPIVDRYTAETYGVMVYQEQVMQVVHGLGGIKLRDAYTLIKNISKKKHDKIEKERPKFVDGAQKQGLTKAQAEELFEVILKFAGYGFNKSHSTGYAIVAYQTAYLKTYFPAQYMAAFLTFESQANKVSEWTPYLEDARKTRAIDPASGRVLRPGLEVRPPDINLSGADFNVVFAEDEPRTPATGHIRFGLKAIKGVGDKAIDAIIRERDATQPRRPYTSLFDFAERVLAATPGVLNKTTLESLIKCGAFDGVHGRGARAALVATIDQAIAAGQKAAADRAAGQGALFGFAGPADDKPAAVTLARATPWTESDTLKNERDVLGFYISSHPLESWRPWWSAFVTGACASLKDAVQDQRIVLAGMVQSVRTLVAKSGRSVGQKMAAMALEDSSGTVECFLFTDAFARYGHLCEPDKVVFALGRADLKRGEPQLLVEKLLPIDAVPLMPGRFRICVDEARLNGGAAGVLTRLADSLNARLSAPLPGTTRTLGHTHGANGHANGYAQGTNGTNGHAKPVAAPKADPGTLFPVEIQVDLPDRSAVLSLPVQSRLALSPEALREIESIVGAGAARVVGGVSVELTRDGPKRWSRRGDDDD